MTKPMPAKTDAAKQSVHDFWNAAACGEDLYLAGQAKEDYAAQAQARYALEPYIADLAKFDGCRGLAVLEIGVGLGADHQRFAEAGATLFGIDLTERAVQHTQVRLRRFGFSPRVTVGDAENLAFGDGSFDVVYSWGVLHHSPNTPTSIAEVYRVLRPGGSARIMIYHTWSLVGLMLWVRYALLRGTPWRSLKSIYNHHLESPGTKAYSVAEGRALFAKFEDVRIRTVLTHGDLLESGAGQRHQGALLSLARNLWPRTLLRRVGQGLGLFMLIEARKPS